MQHIFPLPLNFNVTCVEDQTTSNEIDIKQWVVLFKYSLQPWGGKNFHEGQLMIKGGL